MNQQRTTITLPTTSAERDLHARQLKWEAVLRRPYADPDLTATCQSILREERYWLNAANAIQAGIISPRALDAIVHALNLPAAHAATKEH